MACSEKEPSAAAVEQPAGAKSAEEQELPENNLPLVFFSLLLATFLVGVTSFIFMRISLMGCGQAALDQTM